MDMDRTVQRIMLLLFALGMVFGAAGVHAAEAAQGPSWTTQVTPVCPQNVCLEGGQATYQLRITNTGSVPIVFSSIALQDDKGLVFASQSFQGTNATLPVGQTVTATLQGAVPGPTKGSLVYYQIAYDVGGKVYTDNVRAMTIMPLSQVQCVNNAFCSPDRACVAYRCIPRSLLNATQAGAPAPGQPISLQDVLLIVMTVLLALVVVKVYRRR